MRTPARRVAPAYWSSSPHARSLVDLIHKCSLALCDWQKQTTEDLLEKMTGLTHEELRERGLIG